MTIGATIGGAALGALMVGLCDFNCFSANVAAIAIGAGVGGVIGRGIGEGVSAVKGSWMTIYRPNGSR